MVSRAEFEDKIHEECGIVGVCGHSDSVGLTSLALHALQHRGQESAGIAVANKEGLRFYRKLGLVSDMVRKLRGFKDFKGFSAIGHTRYSTTGVSNLINSQPILIDYKNGQLAIAHNGNLTNAGELRKMMEEKGHIFHSTNDSEIILHLIARSRKKDTVNAIAESLRKVRGAFSLVILTKDKIIAARDPLGIRPLCLGRRARSWVAASETCAFDIIGAKYVRDLEPGEMVVLQKGSKPKSIRFAKKKKSAHCIFEYIYFSRPDSRVFGQNVDKIRRAFGRRLAEENPVDADIVVPVPDSSNTAALGYAQASGISYELGLIRNHYVGRTFISPVQKDREARVKIKFNPVRGVLKGKKVIIVEDSIVRGTTLAQLIKYIRTAAPKEIHIRVSSPPVRYPCYYGMDFPTQKELIANRMSVEKTRKYLGADTLSYLSIPGLHACVSKRIKGFCDACFSGKYPGNCKMTTRKDIFEKPKSLNNPQDQGGQ